MQNKIIRLCYRKVVDADAQKPWDKLVWEDTYREFLMQVQTFNEGGKYKRYNELIDVVPGAAEKLPFLVSSVVVGYLKQLNGIVPDVMNALDKTFLLFKNFKFEIIESDSANKAAHKVAITFISEPLTWLDTVNGMLLLSLNGNKDANDGALFTEMVALQPLLSIFSLQNERE